MGFAIDPQAVDVPQWHLKTDCNVEMQRSTMVRAPAARPLLLHPLLASCDPSSASRPTWGTRTGDRNLAFPSGPPLTLWREEGKRLLSQRLHARPVSTPLAI